MPLRQDPVETSAARAANPGVDLEVLLLDDMWIRRVGSNYFPDPEYLNHDDRAWPKWLTRSDKFLRDATDYWFHLYKPEPGDTIVDIGAGRGEDVFAFSHAVGPRGRVWAIEPHPVSYAALVTLCQLNKLDNVTTVNRACVDTRASLQIESMPVWESNYVRSGAPTPTSYAVQGLRFDDIAAQHKIDRIDFMKMNIEGAERAALPGCVGALQRTRFACIAAHDFRADRGEGDQFRTLPFVRDFLKGTGFSLVTRDEDPRYYVPYHVHGVR
ncbi:MAG TPA: FkbM family methyltransferase [Bryobacteraceae bacterium]|nr:FkbM family methyltransferase [Bryobacteraceae bacterium]